MFQCKWQFGHNDNTNSFIGSAERKTRTLFLSGYVLRSRYLWNHINPRYRPLFSLVSLELLYECGNPDRTQWEGQLKVFSDFVTLQFAMTFFLPLHPNKDFFKINSTRDAWLRCATNAIEWWLQKQLESMQFVDPGNYFCLNPQSVTTKEEAANAICLTGNRKQASAPGRPVLIVFSLTWLADERLTFSISAKQIHSNR
jgi:hypothetical protein